MTVLVLYLIVNELKWDWFVDLPELTTIQFGSSAFQFVSDNESSEMLMRSGCVERNWWLDLPKLTSLTTVDYSNTFRNPRIITLEGNSCHSILISRYAQSHQCYSCQGARFQREDDRSYEEYLFFLSFILRHHFCSSILPRVFSFLYTPLFIKSIIQLKAFLVAIHCRFHNGRALFIVHTFITPASTTNPCTTSRFLTNPHSA